MRYDYDNLLERRGAPFAMLALGMAAAENQSEFATEIISRRFGANSRVALVAKGAEELGQLTEYDRIQLVSKGAVTAATGLAGNWSAALSAYFEAMGEFFDVQRYFEIPASMETVRRVSFHARLIGAASGATAAFVKSGAPAPISSGVLTSDSLRPLKVASTVFVSNEALEFGDPIALSAFISDLASANANAINVAFIDASNAGVAEQTPASVTNGVSAVTATTDPRADIKGVLATHPNAHKSYVVGHPSLLAGMASAEFPNVGARGGEVGGVPALASAAVPDTDLVFIDGSGIALARGGVEISTAREASLIPSDAPSGAATQVSLWQAGATAVMTTQFVNWTKVRSNAVSVISGAAYGD